MLGQQTPLACPSRPTRTRHMTAQDKDRSPSWSSVLPWRVHSRFVVISVMRHAQCERVRQGQIIPVSAHSVLAVFPSRRVDGADGADHRLGIDRLGVSLSSVVLCRQPYAASDTNSLRHRVYGPLHARARATLMSRPERHHRCLSQHHHRSHRSSDTLFSNSLVATRRNQRTGA